MCASSLLLAALLGQAVSDVAVPERLRAVTCPPELSGLAWAAPLDGYLAVSDDTGLKANKTYHAPFVLLLSRAGALDAQPVPLKGVASLDDAESITRGPGDTFFLTTSHSHDREGRVRPARRQLLWLSLDGRALAVKAALDLTAVADAQGRSLARLAAGRDGDLDVEALAFRDGDLLVGLKSPLDDAGAATIVRLAGVEQSFAAGRVAPESVSAWARLHLDVEGPDGAKAPEGVTDLLFLPDGTLVLTANAPKSGRPDGGGAVWAVKAPPSGAPELVRRFKGLKPEGVALAPDGRSLVVVFDRGQEVPQWARLALP